MNQRALTFAEYPRSKPKMQWVMGKRDGNYITLRRNPEGLVTATTRLGNEITEQFKESLPQAYARLLKAPLNHGVNFVGELFPPGGVEPASQVKSRLAKGMPLDFEVFFVEDMHDTLKMLDFATYVGLDFVKFLRWEDWNQRLEAWPGYEGLVFRNDGYTHCFKWKPTRTVDCEVIGWVWGKDGSKYEFTLGALVVRDPEGNEFQVSGMKDAERDDWCLNDSLIVGKVVEVAYERLDSAGGYRHPRFKRIHPEK